MKIKDAMTENPVTLPPETTISDAVKEMVARNIGSILIQKDKEIIGIVTERDILTRVIAVDKNPQQTTLNEVMSKPVIHTKDNWDLIEASELMKKNEIRRLAVFDKKNNLVGIITSDDIARSLRRSVEELASTYYMMYRVRGK